MYDRHYEVMKEITADLKELCDQSDGANKFDFGAAVADAQKNSIPTVRRRKLVWWQQLCEPTLASLDQIMDSLEIASPQLQCFAEKCTEKKATEANAFEALKAAHNGYVSALNTYKTKADAFNGYVDTKEEQKAGVIAKLESFHAGKQATSKIYARDKASFDRFDSGADAGHCGLTSCQVKTVCHAHIKDYFASFINPDTCQAVPMTVDQVCKGTTRVEDSDAAKDTLFTIPTDDASQAECYGARYWDLRAAFGSDDTALGNHFTKYTGSGRENRDASCALSDAEARCYIDRYEDAKAFAGADLEKAREHYYETGISEHRDFVCPPGVKELKCYVERYADLKQAFGTNYDTPGTSSALYKAGKHWFKNGKAENRDYSC